jgi:hypothetical protein
MTTFMPCIPGGNERAAARAVRACCFILKVSIAKPDRMSIVLPGPGGSQLDTARDFA